MKSCTKCGKIKPLTEFHKDARSSDKHTASCKICRCLHTKKYVEQAKLKPCWTEKQKAKNVQYAYGVSFKYLSMVLEGQDFKCAICSVPINLRDGSGHIDHDHFTGKVRGILCFNCNVGLGNFKDSMPNLEKAYQYLKEHNDCT